jgi:FkbM family methyltransferase
MLPKALGMTKPAAPAGLARGPLVALVTLALLAAAAVWAPTPSGTSLSLRGDLPASSAALDAAYDAWLATYRAPNPEHQKFCEGALRNAMGAGEYAQDMYIFFNIFKHWPAAGRRGVYVDSGTNEPEKDTNTLFFDRCLGWKGICVEPQELYWQSIEKKRSCTLVKGCLAAETVAAAVVGHGPMAQVQAVGGAGDSGENSGAGAVQCHRLEDVLKEAGVNPPRIDFWSLDVEGAEMCILAALNFTTMSVGALLIEDFWISQRDLDRLMTTRDFVKVQQMAADSVWVPRGAPLVEPGWAPPLGDVHWAKLKAWRKQLIAEKKVKAE